MEKTFTEKELLKIINKELFLQYAKPVKDDFDLGVSRTLEWLKIQLGIGGTKPEKETK